MKSDFIPFGTQYYRAPTPVRGDWRRDLQNIKDCGFNTIKLFVMWRWNHPADGNFYFDDVDELMDLAAGFGLKVIINLVFDAAPAWLFVKYPDCVMITADGRRVEPQTVGHRSVGGAPGPCLNHPESLRARMDFLAAMAGRYREHPALYIWDLWNEPEMTCAILRKPEPQNLVCYCPHCRDRFNEWLRKKYLSLDGLNRRWHRNYQRWEEVEMPRCGDAFVDMIDWRLFFADVMTGELRLRMETLKAVDPSTPAMVHTVPIPAFNAVTCCNNDYDLAAECDLFGNSTGSSPFAAAFNTSCAGRGKTVINSEIHALGGSTYSRPLAPTFADIKAHIFTPFARGIKGFIYWQYRPERLGTESPAWGLTAPDGSGTPWLEHNAAICAALQREAALIGDVWPIPARVAVLNSYKAQIFDWCASGTTSNYNHSVLGMFNALYAANLNVDIINADALKISELGRYKAVLMPFPYCFDPAVSVLLRDWVSAGGLLVAEAFPGTVNADTGLHETTLPGLGLHEVFGVTEGAVISSVQPEITLTAGTAPIGMPGWNFQEELLPADGTQVIGRFTNGAPAVTVNKYGRGKAVLAGTLIGCAYHKRLPNYRNIIALIQMFIDERKFHVPVRTGNPELRADLLTGKSGGALLVINARNARNAEKTEAEIIIAEPIGAKKAAIDLMTGVAYPLEAVPDGLRLKITLDPNHHEVYKLV